MDYRTVESLRNFWQTRAYKIMKGSLVFEVDKKGVFFYCNGLLKERSFKSVISKNERLQKGLENY